MDQVIEKLQQLLPAFFHQDEQLQSLSCDKEMEKEALEKMAAFTEQLPHSPERSSTCWLEGTSMTMATIIREP